MKNLAKTCFVPFKFINKLSHERDVFPFYINCITYLDNNIPSEIFYGLIGSEILHIVRTTSKLINMATPANLLLI